MPQHTKTFQSSQALGAPVTATEADIMKDTPELSSNNNLLLFAIVLVIIYYNRKKK